MARPTPPPPPEGLRALYPGQVLLIYTADGPVGGTFTCAHCAAQAWQPDLLAHAATCAYGSPARDDAPVTPPR